MQRSRLIAVSFLVSIFWAGVALAEPISIPKDGATRPLLKSIYAGLHQIGDFKKKDTKALVCIFLAIDCPVSRQYATPLATLYDRFKNEHVQFIGLYPNARVDIMSMAMDSSQ